LDDFSRTARPNRQSLKTTLTVADLPSVLSRCGQEFRMKLSGDSFGSHSCPQPFADYHL